MALQDDIFDVQAALDGKPEAPAFSRIYDHLSDLEAANEQMYAILSDLSTGVKAVMRLAGHEPRERKKPKKAGGRTMRTDDLIEVSVDETSELIRLTTEHGPVKFIFGDGVYLDTVASPWAEPILWRLRGVTMEDGAGI